MRLPVARVVFAGCLLAAVAPAQEVKYWPLSKISFPVDLAEFNKLSPKPASIRFYAAPPGKEFKLIANRKPSELDEIVDTKDPAATPRRGFSYDATADGDMEFAVQYDYGDGTLTPAKLTPQFRIKFDTRPPLVKAVASGASGIKWQVEDENLIRESIRVEGRYPGETQWQFLNTGDLKPEDSFKWNVPPGKTLEVRVYARDRAGHENRSTPIKLTGDDRKSDLDKPGGPTAPPPPSSFGDPVKTPAVGKTGYGGLDDLPANRPKIDYLSTNKLRVSSKITHVTRSGVKAAQLYVQEPANGAEWKAAGKLENLTITADSPDDQRVVSIDYEAPRDGLYGFIIQPISGAGTKLEDPRPGDTPQFLVEVDTTIPEMSFKKVSVTGSGLNGPLVEIEWEAKDKNLNTAPIDLEYSEDQQKWKSIARQTANTGRYTWEITDKKLWKFYVRGQATDLARNAKLVTYDGDDKKPQAVLVDLDKPSGAVDKVNPNGNSTSPKPKGIGYEAPGVSGGGVSGVGVTPTPPGQLNITPAGNGEKPKPADPPSSVPPLGGTVTPPPVPPVNGPPVPPLPPKDEPKKVDPPKPEPKKEEPKKDEKKPEEKKVDVLLPDAPPAVVPVVVPPPTDTLPAVVPIPIPNK